MMFLNQALFILFSLLIHHVSSSETNHLRHHYDYPYDESNSNRELLQMPQQMNQLLCEYVMDASGQQTNVVGCSFLVSQDLTSTAVLLGCTGPPTTAAAPGTEQMKESHKDGTCVQATLFVSPQMPPTDTTTPTPPSNTGGGTGGGGSTVVSIPGVSNTITTPINNQNPGYIDTHVTNPSSCPETMPRNNSPCDAENLRCIYPLKINGNVASGSGWHCDCIDSDVEGEGSYFVCNSGNVLLQSP